MVQYTYIHVYVYKMLFIELFIVMDNRAFNLHQMNLFWLYIVQMYALVVTANQMDVIILSLVHITMYTYTVHVDVHTKHLQYTVKCTCMYVLRYSQKY